MSELAFNIHKYKYLGFISIALCNFTPSAPITNGKSINFTFLVWSPNSMSGISLITFVIQYEYPSINSLRKIYRFILNL